VSTIICKERYGVLPVVPQRRNVSMPPTEEIHAVTRWTRNTTVVVLAWLLGTPGGHGQGRLGLRL
jgi:hypothetical protein